MATPSKNSRVARDKVALENKTKRPYWLYPFRPGKAVKPCGYYHTEEAAIAAQSSFAFETRVGSWGNMK